MFKKITNQDQFNRLIGEMKQNPEMAIELTTGNPNVNVDFWAKITIELNDLGPPQKSPKEWKKVWSDYKASLRKKLANKKVNKEEANVTPIRLTLLEEEVVTILNLNDQVEVNTNDQVEVNTNDQVEVNTNDQVEVNTNDQKNSKSAESLKMSVPSDENTTETTLQHYTHKRKTTNVEDHEEHPANIYARHLACELRNLPPREYIYVQKFFNDILFEAKLGSAKNLQIINKHTKSLNNVERLEGNVTNTVPNKFQTIAEGTYELNL